MNNTLNMILRNLRTEVNRIEAEVFDLRVQNRTLSKQVLMLSQKNGIEEMINDKQPQ